MSLSGSAITAFGLESVLRPPYPEDCQTAWVGTDWKLSSYQSIPMLQVLVTGLFFSSCLRIWVLGGSWLLLWSVWYGSVFIEHHTVGDRQFLWLSEIDFSLPVPSLLFQKIGFFFLVNTKYKHRVLLLLFILNISISELFWGTHILDMCVCRYPELTLIIENTGELELRSVYLIKDTSG